MSDDGDPHGDDEPKHPPGERRKLVLFVAEAALERRLVDEVKAAGATGYTISDVRGGGTSGERDGSGFGPSRSIELRVICTDEVAERLTRRVIDAYGPHFSVITFIAEGTVLRPDRF